MKSLLLSGHGISINVDSGKLKIKNGIDADRRTSEYLEYKPKFLDIDNIILYGNSGNISLSAIKWMMKQNLPVSVMDWNGRILTNMNPPQSKHSYTQMAQYQAYNSDLRLDIGKKFIDSKFVRSGLVIDWLTSRYPNLEESAKNVNIDLARKNLKKANTLKEILGVEGALAHFYWDVLGKTFDPKFEFVTRGYGRTKRPFGAVDPINAIFNYGYSILESYCWKSINSANLDPYVGFIHEMNQSKASLVYDLQEPFRWLVDLTILQMLERNDFKKNDFIVTDDYSVKMRVSGVAKLNDEISSTFSGRVKFKNQNRQWSKVIDHKARELSDYLNGKRKTLDFSNPKYTLERADTQNLREKILSITYREWRDFGFSTGALNYLKKNAKSEKPFTVNSHVKERLESWRG